MLTPHRLLNLPTIVNGRGRGWDDLGEWHWSMYNIIYETSRQSRFDARYWMLGAGALGQPRGMVWEGRREEGSGWGTHVYLWQIHFDIWQNQYNIVKLKNKIKLKKKKRKEFLRQMPPNIFLWSSKQSCPGIQFLHYFSMHIFQLLYNSSVIVMALLFSF